MGRVAPGSPQQEPLVMAASLSLLEALAWVPDPRNPKGPPVPPAGWRSGRCGLRVA